MSVGPAIVDATPQKGGVVVGRLEVDRFCDKCGYNLHGQLVTREPHTDLLVCRCSECGRFHPAAEGVTAGRIWLNRLGLFMVFVWITTSIGIVLMLGALHVGICMGTLDELTVTTYIPPPSTGSRFIAGSNYTPQFQQMVKQPGPYTTHLIVAMLALTFLIGYLLIGWFTLSMHHWPRRYYLLAITVFALGLLLLESWIWAINFPGLAEWGALYIRGFGLACLVGGVLAAFVGRPLGRVLARVMLPPRPRQLVSFLWTADRLKPPTLPPN